MLKIIYTCVGVALATYTIFSTGSLATWNDQKIKPNIINNYPSDGIQFIIARMLYIVLLTFTMPIIYYPARESILNIFEFFSPSFLRTHYKTIYTSTVILMLLFTWAITCINPPLDFVLGVIGSSAAPIICFFLPAFFWLKIDPDKSRWNRLRLGCFALLAFALVSTAFSIVALMLNFGK
jgi:amino acid permease